MAEDPEDQAFAADVAALNAAVDAFAARMKAKLLRKAHQGYSGWADASPDILARLLYQHLFKGDVVDIANFCMMLDHQKKGAKLVLEFKAVARP